MSSDREDQNLFSESSNIMDNVYKYPEGLRILAVDDNPVCLKLLSAVLKKCRYQFTATTEASEAYEILKKNRNSYDLVLTDVKNNMDEFKFAQLIDLEMDIPVIIMSADDGKESVMNGIKHGARNYLLKPVRYEELKIIWQHVARKNHFQLEKKSLENAITNPNPIPLRQIDDDNEQEEETKAIVISEIKKTKKQRFSWKPDVHAKFVNAVDQLGVENAVPKKILQLMNEPNLSRENVASHLQKYRKHSDEQKKKAKTDLSSMGMDRDIGGNYQNGLEQPVIDNNDLISYGTNIRAICNNVKSQEGISQNQLQFLGTGDKISHTIRNNEVDSNWNQNFGQTQGVNGMRFNSFCSRPTRMENNYYYNGYSSPSVRPSNSLLMLPSNSSYGPIRSQSNNMARHADSLPMLPLSSSYDEIQMPDASRSIQMVQPTYSLPMLPSSSFGQNQMLDATHLTHMGQRTNSLPMLPSSSSYGQIQMNNANHSIQKAQSTNSLPMLATSSTYGQLERGDSFVFNGKEETNSFLFDTREQNIECLPWDPIDIGCDFDDIGDLFNDNSAPSLG